MALSKNPIDRTPLTAIEDALYLLCRSLCQVTCLTFPTNLDDTDHDIRSEISVHSLTDLETASNFSQVLQLDAFPGSPVGAIIIFSIAKAKSIGARDTHAEGRCV